MGCAVSLSRRRIGLAALPPKNLSFDLHAAFVWYMLGIAARVSRVGPQPRGTTVDPGEENMPAQVVDVGAKVARLRHALDEVRRRRAWRAGWTRRWVPTGLAALDAALPGGGLPCGAVTEILCDTPGVGAMTVALRTAGACLIGAENTERETEGRSSTFEVRREGTEARRHEGTEGRRDGGSKGARDQDEAGGALFTTPHSASVLDAKCQGFAIPHSSFLIPQSPHPILDSPFAIRHSARVIVFVDREGDFYPPAAWGLGLPVDRLVVVRPGNERDAYWAMDQSLRCAAVAVVVGSLGGLNDSLARRLQLAAETCGGLGILLRPVARPTHRFAAVRMRIEGAPPPLEQPDARRCRITLLAVREGTPVEPFVVDLNHETGAGDPSALPGDAAAAG